MLISTLDRKLVRDLWALRGPAIAIALVIAAGLSAVMMSLSTLDSLSASRAKFYADNGFSQLFAPLRLALTGLSSGPELNQLLPLLGRPNTLARLSAPAGRCESSSGNRRQGS